MNVLRNPLVYRILLSLGAISVLAALLGGCTGLTLGPQIKTEYVIMHPGKPCQVLENKNLVVRTFEGKGDPVIQDVGGWVAMPESHWQAVKKELEKKP